MDEQEQSPYQWVRQRQGVKITACANRLEIVIEPGTDAQEQKLQETVKEWVRKRRADQKLREPGDLPE